MEGVTILAQNEIIIASAFNWSSFWLTVGFLAFFGLIFGFMAWRFENDLALGILIFSLTVIIGGFTLGTIVGSATATPTKYEVHYKVVVDDDVNLIQFYEKYEIIEQEGKIFTVREKEKIN